MLYTYPIATASFLKNVLKFRFDWFDMFTWTLFSHGLHGHWHLRAGVFADFFLVVLPFVSFVVNS